MKTCHNPVSSEQNEFSIDRRYKRSIGMTSTNALYTFLSSHQYTDEEMSEDTKYFR